MRWLILAASLLVCLTVHSQEPSFINFETPHVHPLDISPDALWLAACNTADGRVELYTLESGMPVHSDSIAVGLEPVSVRFRTPTELWVINHVSDSVSVISIATRSVISTLHTDDEPADVVFAGSPQKAFVSCSQANTVLVFNLGDLDAAPARIPMMGEDPRALAVNATGSRVYVAIFESGNRSTILGGGSGDPIISFPPNVVDDLDAPHAGANPAFNGNGMFIPSKDPGNGLPPKVGLIVKQNAAGQWVDDTGENWSDFVSGTRAFRSGRPQGWQLLDNDLAIINASDNSVSYVGGLMNICMGLAVNPSTGHVSVIGTDAMNELRFEPNVNGIFLRVLHAAVDPGALSRAGLQDLNPHLNYHVRTIPQQERDKSLGDPRALVWNPVGSRGYVAGMGSNNVVVINASGARAGIRPTIEVREGPTGLAMDYQRGLLYVLNRFHGSVSVVDLGSELEVRNLPFHDATPAVIKVGRKHLYDTHKTSGLGHVACGSCHVDARMDKLAWDLGDPSGTVKNLNNLNLGGNMPGLDGVLGRFDPFHPMKGPMVTQTLQGIIGHEPLHWRGDRLSLEEFNPAFIGLQADDEELSETEMEQYSDYLSTLYFPPNPYRNADNSLPTDLPLPGHYKSGRFGTRGEPLPNGNAQRGLEIYRNATRRIDQGVASCIQCHTIPTGAGTGSRWNGIGMVPIAPGPRGENHLMLVSIDGSTQTSIKVPQLRNLYEKVGFEMTQTVSRAGFGFLHDGSIDSLAQFVSELAFNTRNDQEVADLVALMLAWSGSDFPTTALTGTLFEPPGTFSLDTHASVGRQVTLSGGGLEETCLNTLIALVEQSPRIQLIAHQRQGAYERGWLYEGGGAWQRDAAGQTQATAVMLSGATHQSPVTATIVVAGTGARLALDRDLDGYLNQDEVLAGTDPADPLDFGDPEGEGEASSEGEGAPDGEGPAEGEGAVEGEGEGWVPGPVHSGDMNADGVIDIGELLRVIQLYNSAGYHCETFSEDGFGPGRGDERCAPHASDFEVQDWVITLTELLRLIQLFNAGAYHPCVDEETEDRFCPGIAPTR